MSDAYTSLRDIHSIHTCPKLLTAFPAQQYTLFTL